MSEVKKNYTDTQSGSPLQLSANDKVLLDANIYRTAFSVDELRPIVLSSNFPIAGASCILRTADGEVVLQQEYKPENHPAFQLSFDKMLPFAELTAFERSEPPFYFFEVQVTPENGKTLTSPYSFSGHLVKGCESTVPPYTDLKERLAAIPIATPDMSEEELRAICVAYMDLQTEFPFTLPFDVDAYIVSQKKQRILRAGVVHGGLPYITAGSGSLYRVAEFYDEKTGMIGADADFLHAARLFGNACSGAACCAWARVINSTKSGYTVDMCAANGYLPVGDYKYDFAVKQFTPKSIAPDSWSCKRICAENGEQVMFESYALVKPADGAIHDGHVRMFVEAPVVVRNADGTINGAESHVAMSEQICYSHRSNNIRLHPDGSHYTACGGTRYVYTFQNLFETNYIPFTFAEFLGTKKVEIAEVSVFPKSDGVYTVANISDLTLTTNYNISDIFLTVTDDSGKQLWRQVYRSRNFSNKSYTLADVFPADLIAQLAQFRGNTVAIDVQLYNGQKLNALTAKFE